jgi:hypothetical protein
MGSAFSDVFVTRINAAGDALLFSTFIGGTKGETALGLAVDGSGVTTVVGTTSSTHPWPAPPMHSSPASPLAAALSHTVRFSAGDRGTKDYQSYSILPETHSSSALRAQATFRRHRAHTTPRWEDLPMRSWPA